MTIAAVVLAAGLSRRMGAPKLALPWGGTTIIRHVVDVLSESGLDQVLVVTGGAHAQVTAALHGTATRLAFNPDFENGEMLSSVQVGLRSLPSHISAALICLGDQPQIQTEVVRAVIDLYRTSASLLVVPSYRSRRGHPWLVASALWPAIWDLNPPDTLRLFLQTHAMHIHYCSVDSPSVLVDIDTPEDYAQQRP
jgi:molybdenum cofactor cytidylyltransferase